jgi:hypothetical protein
VTRVGLGLLSQPVLAPKVCQARVSDRLVRRVQDLQGALRCYQRPLFQRSKAEKALMQTGEETWRLLHERRPRGPAAKRS